MSCTFTSPNGSLYVQFSPDESPEYEYMGQVIPDTLAKPRDEREEQSHSPTKND